MKADADRTPRLNVSMRTAFLAALWILCVPGNARPLQTTLDFRDTQQINRIGETETSRFYTRRGVISVREAGRFQENWLLEGTFQYLREDAGGSISADTERRTYRPALSLAYRNNLWNVGGRADWLRREDRLTIGPALRSDENRLLAWLTGEVTSSTRLASNFSYNRSQREQIVSAQRERDELSAYLLATQHLGQRFLFDYRFSGGASDLISETVYRRRWSHELKLSGSPQFSGGRGTTSILARTRFATDTSEFGVDEERSVYREPARARVILDSTPETHDPLEDQGTLVPALFDGDRGTPTSVNIGDAASVVLEWGGDYRNLVYDFSLAESFASAVLYIDQRLLIPEYFQWRIFVTDDPDARVWFEVPADRATVRYGEWGTDLQGWEVSLAPDVGGRFFKMVNVKFGQTPPDVFVTELEVFVREQSVARTDRSDAQRYELDGRVGYEITSAWRMSYQGRAERRSFNEARRNVDEISQILFSRYDFSREYATTASFQKNLRLRRNAPDEDVTIFNVALQRNRSLPLSGSVSYNRRVDRGRGLDLTTDSAGLLVAWQALPRLQIRQNLSAGRTVTPGLATESRSFASISRIDGTIVRSLWARVVWSERWSSLDLGVGYDRFSEGRLDATWSITPLLLFASRSTYQRRDDPIYDTRQTLTWTPWRGGALEPAFSGQIYYDSRVEVWEQGFRFDFLWKLRAGLRLDGSVQWRRYLLANRIARPVTTNFHATWSF